MGDRDELALLATSIQLQIDPNMSTSAMREGKQAIERWAWREACLMIAKPLVWRGIVRLTDHLLVNETASEAEVIKIVREAGACYQPKLLHLATASQPNKENAE
jgi:hypothetical protein